MTITLLLRSSSRKCFAGSRFVQPLASPKISFGIRKRGGKEKTSAKENTIPPPPGVRKSMVGRRRLGSPAVADARTPHRGSFRPEFHAHTSTLVPSCRLFLSPSPSSSSLSLPPPPSPSSLIFLHFIYCRM